jgi:hypothetical protein
MRDLAPVTVPRSIYGNVLVLEAPDAQAVAAEMQKVLDRCDAEFGKREAP